MNTTERIGVSKVQLIVYEKLHWIFREQVIDDCGIDAHIELKDDDYVTGKLIAVQIKSGESYFKENNKGKIVYYIDKKHFNYWMSNILPVILILYNTKTGECIWEYVGKAENNRKIVIDRLHKFDENAKNELIEIANVEPYKIAEIHRKKFIEENNSLEVLRKLSNDKRHGVKRDVTYKGQIVIDFGTTRTMIGVVLENEKVFCVKTEGGKDYFDTVVGFDENYKFYIGAEALKRKNISDTIIIRNFKRELGFGKKYKIFKLMLSAEDITVLFFSCIINYIEAEYEILIKECVISEPIDFSYYQKSIYESCIKKCNLSIARRISESTCISISEFDDMSEKNGIIIDMGGGTFDSTFFEMSDGILDVLNVIGDRTVGGVDYDYALGKYIENILKEKYPGILLDDFLKDQIVYKAEEVKIELSTKEKATIIIPELYCANSEINATCCIEITREDFRKITGFLNKKVENLLNEFKKQVEEYPYLNSIEITLSGYGSKIFTIKEIISKCFPGIPVIDLYSDKKVVGGLMRYSEKIQGLPMGKDILLLDVLGYDILLVGEELFFNNKNYDKNGIKISSRPLFVQEEYTTEFYIIHKDVSIPTKKHMFFGIKKIQKISVIAKCGKHSDEVALFVLNNYDKESVYKIMLDCDAHGKVLGEIESMENNEVIIKFSF